MKIKYEPVKKHYNHPITIQFGDYKPHKAKVICKLCNEFVKWANPEEIKIWRKTNEST